MALFDHLLITTDGSEASSRAADVGVRVAATYGAAVTALHVIERDLIDEMADASGQGVEAVRSDMRAAGEAYLDHVAEMAEEAGVEFRREVREGDAHEAVLAVADQLAADLIVMGHVGRKGAERALVGSVTERVIRLAQRPVLVVP